jgi:hypothetical protein
MVQGFQPRSICFHPLALVRLRQVQSVVFADPVIDTLDIMLQEPTASLPAMLLIKMPTYYCTLEGLQLWSMLVA